MNHIQSLWEKTILRPFLTDAGRWFFWTVAPYFCAALPKNAHYEEPRYGKSMAPPSKKLFRAENRRSMAAILLSISDGGNNLSMMATPTHIVIISTVALAISF